MNDVWPILKHRLTVAGMAPARARGPCHGRRVACLPFAILAPVLLASTPQGQVIFHETFREKLQPGWTWIREDPANWRLTDHGLEVRIQPGNMWGPANNARNVLVRPAPDPQPQTLEITAAVENHPTHQYEQVDLVWYFDD